MSTLLFRVNTEVVLTQAEPWVILIYNHTHTKSIP